MACAEPSWANVLAPPQLIGLLNLCVAFCGVAYFSDVQLGDNAMFFDSFREPGQSRLYRHVRDLAERSLVKVMLRDASLRPGGPVPVVECDSFSDVLESWIAQDDESAWINPGVSSLRRAYFRDLDSWASGEIVQRYSYGEIKSSFMANVRHLATTEVAPQARGFLARHDGTLTSDYASVVAQDWFTLSDVYSVLHRNGVPPGNAAFLRHGLVNELAYGRAAKATLVGADDERQVLEGMFWGEPAEEAMPEAPNVSRDSVVAALLERANAVLEAPDLSVLALLNADELTEVMVLGRGYFDLTRLAQDGAYVEANPDLTERLLSELTTYWQRICDFLVDRHPTAVTRPTRLGLFVGQMPRAVQRLGGSGLSLALNIGTPAADLVIPGSAATLREAENAAKRSISFRFLFTAQREEMRRLRALLPPRGWVARPRASVIVPPSS